jgi:hypothetical protein
VQALRSRKVIYRTRKLHYVAQSLIPAAWLVVLAGIVIVRGGDHEWIWLVAAVPVVLGGIFIYAAVKQSKTPLVQTTADEIRVNNVWRSPEAASWGLVTGLKWYPVLGYKLETIGGSIWLPLGMLTSSDAQSLLREVREHVERENRG